MEEEDPNNRVKLFLHTHPAAPRENLVCNNVIHALWLSAGSPLEFEIMDLSADDGMALTAFTAADPASRDGLKLLS